MDEDHIKLRSGTVVYANCGVLGIFPDLRIAEGFDGRIPSDPDDPDCSLAPEDVAELCAIAIDRWQRLKARAARASACPDADLEDM